MSRPRTATGPLPAALATRAAVAACLALGNSWPATAQAADERTPLAVCMAERNPPLSFLVGDRLGGLDLRLAEAVARELGRPLKPVPFESKVEMETTLSQEVNALLSSGVCELASGFPLLAGDVGAPARATARVPDHPGAPRRALRPWIALGELVPSRPYHAVAMGLLVRDPARESATLATLGDARIGVTAGTMAGAVISLYRNGRLRSQAKGLSQSQDALAELDAGRIDATLATLDRFDAYRLAHPQTSIRRAAYLHPLRINIGFVARAEATGPMAAANRVIDRARASGELEAWSAASGVTWIAPVEPWVGGAIGLGALVDN